MKGRAADDSVIIENAIPEIKAIYSQTGKYPAVMGFDFLYTGKTAKENVDFDVNTTQLAIGTETSLTGSRSASGMRVLVFHRATVMLNSALQQRLIC